MSFFSSMEVSATALTAERVRMDVISQNVANANTTRTADGTPYQRKTVVFEENTSPTDFATDFEHQVNSDYSTYTGNGVKVTSIETDTSEGDKIYEPGHPDADENGYVTLPNVNIVDEMVNMISASRAYEANITAMNVTKSMIAKTLELSK